MQGCLLAAPTPLVTAAPALQLGAFFSPTLPPKAPSPASSAWLRLHLHPSVQAVGPRTGQDAEVGTGGEEVGVRQTRQGDARPMVQSSAATKQSEDNKDHTGLYL